MEFSVYVIADETGIELQGADEFGRAMTRKSGASSENSIFLTPFSRE